MKKKKKAPLVEVSLMLKRDLKDVVDIEKKSCFIDDDDFGVMVADYAWSSSKFIDFIKKSNTYSYVIKEGDLIVGFFLLEIKDSEVLIERICVDKNYRKNGFGKEILNFIYKKDYKNKIIHICREKDVEAIGFFKVVGFKGKLIKNHFDADIDGIKFIKEIS